MIMRYIIFTLSLTNILQSFPVSNNLNSFISANVTAAIQMTLTSSDLSPSIFVNSTTIVQTVSISTLSSTSNSVSKTIINVVPTLTSQVPMTPSVPIINSSTNTFSISTVSISTTNPTTTNDNTPIIINPILVTPQILNQNPPPPNVQSLIDFVKNSQSQQSNILINNTNSNQTNQPTVDQPSSSSKLGLILGITIPSILIISGLVGYSIIKYKEKPIKVSIEQPNEPDLSVNPGTEYICTVLYDPPDETLEQGDIQLLQGDIVTIVERYTDGWASGQNVTSGEIGKFPMNCIEMIKNNDGQ